MTIELIAGDDRIVIDPDAGGRVASLHAGGAERIVSRPPPGVTAELEPVLWGSFVMAPWAGRIAHGRLEWDGEVHELERNGAGHALHGVVFDVPTRIVSVSATTATLAVDLDPQRWPFGGRVDQRVTLAPGRAELVVTVSGGNRAMPVWLGWHPCFRRPDQGDVRVRVDADEVLETGADLIPTGRLLPVDEVTDLRDGRPLGDRRLDHAYPAVRGPMVVAWPDLTLEMSVTHPVQSAVVHTPTALFCVEPQTSWPDALRLSDGGARDTGVHRLEVGDTFTAATTWTWR